MGWGPLGYNKYSSDLTWLCSEKISRHIPTLSVYSKEMSEKICAAELHLSRSHLYSHCSQDFDSTIKVRKLCPHHSHMTLTLVSHQYHITLK